MQAPTPAQAPAAAPRPAPTVPPEFDALPIWKMPAPKLVALLEDPNSTVFQKAIACKKLSMVGGPEAVKPMAALLSDPHLACYARFGMEPNPDPSVDAAFRAALPKLSGKLQIGVIHSIGYRKDPKALDALKKLMGDSDAQVAGAAAASVGMIGGLEAGKILESALKNTEAPTFPVVARSCLLCAEGLMASNKSRALQLYTQLSAKTMPGPVQLAALRVLNSAGPAPAYTKAWTAPTGAAADADFSGFLGKRPKN
jgi:hypothetical protein